MKKIFVGLSGGVDSSTSLYLLKKAGYDVTGVFIKVWQPDFFPCTAAQDRLDAMRVCAALDVPFKTLDLETEYKQYVVDYMLKEYTRGRTPNPDVMCNKYVKFGAFLAWALQNGADGIATGHYAQNIFNTETGEYELHTAVDASKDQSYFLYTLGQEELKRTLFPVGHLHKDEVRHIALKAQLPTHNKKDSQGLCFIGTVNMKDFLAHFIKAFPGMVLDTEGEVIGTHDGAILYTIGERHGFSITVKTAHDKPHYVVGKNIEKNTITVSQEKVSDTFSRAESYLEEARSVSPKGFPEGVLLDAQVRYHGPLTKARVTGSFKPKITFNEPIMLTSGQSLVLFDGTRCLGGGIIV